MAKENTQEAVVVRVDARQCEIRVQREIVPAAMRGRIFENCGQDKIPVAVGDLCLVTQETNGYAITEILPRRNLFSRRSAGNDGRRQILATNVDQIVIVACFGVPPFSSITTDRILSAASSSKIPAVLVLNKLDCAKKKKMEAILTTYRNAGITVLPTSAITGEGVDAFASCIQGKQSVLYGLSGVGKSSLLNYVEDGLGIKTKEVSASLHAGRHTTTFTRMYALQAGGHVIDTPGVRSFRPINIPANELRLHWPEMSFLGRDCRFPACLHHQEPDCAVRQAAETGAIPESRYRSYLNLLEEIQDFEQQH